MLLILYDYYYIILRMVYKTRPKNDIINQKENKHNMINVL